MSWFGDIQSALGWGLEDDDFDKILKARFVDDEEMYNKIKTDQDLYNTLKSTEQSRSLAKRQKLFDIAAEGGAKHGGTAVAGGGTTGLGYANPVDFTKTFPRPMSKEEEEYMLALRGPVPGMMTYRGIS
jgi:hypothetical protein